MFHDSNAFPIISHFSFMTSTCFQSFSSNVPRLNCVSHYFPNWINDKFMLSIIFQQCPTNQMRFPLFPTFDLCHLLAFNHFPAMSHVSNAFPIISHIVLMTNSCFQSFYSNVPRLKCVSHYFPLFIYEIYSLSIILQKCPTTQMRFPLFPTFHWWHLLAFNHFPAMSHDSNAFPIISQIELMTNSCFQSFSSNVPRLKYASNYFPNCINDKFDLSIIFQQCPTTKMRFPLFPKLY